MISPIPNAAFEWRETEAGQALVCRPLEAAAPHLFTTRHWRLGAPSSRNDDGWVEVARAVGVAPGALIRAHQVHGAAVVVRRAGRDRRLVEPLPDADIIISDDPGAAVAVQTADCVPLLLADARSGAVAAAHAGWRGLAARVPAIAVEAMSAEFGSRPDDLIAAIGPSICASRYEVGVEVRRRFEQGGFSAAHLTRWFADGRRPAHWQFDGWQATLDQLEASGLPSDRIHLAGLCTASEVDLFCSYRRDGAPAGRIVGVIRKRNGSAVEDHQPQRKR